MRRETSLPSLPLPSSHLDHPLPLSLPFLHTRPSDVELVAAPARCTETRPNTAMSGYLGPGIAAPIPHQKIPRCKSCSYVMMCQRGPRHVSGTLFCCCPAHK